MVLWGNFGFCGGLDILKIDKNSTDKIMAFPKFCAGYAAAISALEVVYREYLFAFSVMSVML